MYIKNLGDFRRLTSHLSDDTEFITISSNFELNHNFVKARATIEKSRIEKKQFRDAFEGNLYETDVYKQDDDGKITIVVRDY